ncbi:channel protein, hemolysin III family [Chloroherpeton thalassium ATCC 35110]|uniref:Channel protein, hemolysin III family n=1 Tax=Chloroherpeton thalassium (strain ATCC 35110 / GB-78) TaxID=517418 RepID=B3QX13_CHLT3|nr:hemolysin III family protein [Chloroherpeton thalassium]ACF14823.1 channel protein, hemolysin III family [Chloroherpeton thalassium ATCC 35110]
MLSSAQKSDTDFPLKSYTIGEEIANGITHGVGTVLSIIGLILLVRLANEFGDVWWMVSFCIYGGSMILLYLTSTLYHSIQNPKVKYFFRILDHANIYLLIAGTYTPLLLVSLGGAWGWTMLILIWLIAIAGMSLTSLFMKRFQKFSVATYIFMGWIGIFVLYKLPEFMPITGLFWIGAGGLFYTIGVIFYVWKKLPYHHAIWHVFVLGGSACHYIAIFNYLT